MRALFALLVFAALLTACSDAFDPFVESDQTFALYGFLDARRDTQFVRVQTIAERDDVEAEAQVTSTEWASGQTLVWQDTLVQLDDGTVGRAFFALFRPTPGARYRIEAAQRTGTGATVADVRVPPEAPFQAAEPIVIGDGRIVTQRLTLGGALAPERAIVTYTVQRTEGEAEPVAISVTYPVRAFGGTAEVLVSLARDAADIRSALGVDPDDTEGVALLDLHLTYDLVDEAGGAVTGGLGAVGAAAGFTAGWTLAPAFVTAIGLVDAQGKGRGVRRSE